ncbi:Glycinol 4-dimethylallyltransferase, partial [Mucuna pruriens]
EWPLILHRTFGVLGCYASKASQHKGKTQIEYKFLRFGQSSLNHHYKSTKGGSTYQEINEKHVVKVTPGEYSDSEPQASYLKTILDYVKKFWAAFFMFTSPYAMTTQTSAIMAASLLAVDKVSDISSLFFIGVLQVAIPHLFMGIYNASMNQLCDLEIDKINKPYLPLASGQISFTTGVTISTSCLALALLLSWIVGSWPLTCGVLLCGFLWTAYSINVPLLRWKGNPLLAAMCIWATWTIVFPVFSFLHMQFWRSIIIFYVHYNNNQSLSKFLGLVSLYS